MGARLNSRLGSKDSGAARSTDTELHRRNVCNHVCDKECLLIDSMDAIHQELERIAKSVVGTVGVCAQHLESSQRVDYNAGVRFPMGSAYKLPIVAYVLALVDRGQLSLEQMVQVHQSDLSPGSGSIQALLYQPGLILSVRNLIELTLVISDNTASDVLLRLAGGPHAVTRFLRDSGVGDIRIDRPTKYLVADKYGLAGLATTETWSLDQYHQLFERLTEDEVKAAAARFTRDERDTMTPDAMVALLVQVCTTDLITTASRDILLSTMQRSQTGEGALRGMLPPGVTVAHKTGTLAQVAANDVGIITLPAEAGHIAIAVCVQSPEAKGEASSTCQRVIAHSARAAYDHFLFH